MARLGILGITHHERSAIRDAVHLALSYWPNDGEDYTTGELLRRAFRMIRREFRLRGCMLTAAGMVETDAYRYMDM